jgi:hypothetical protein
VAASTGPSRGVPEDEPYYAEIRRLLEGAYLEAEDPRGGSGFRGDAGRWERARRPIASAVDRDGVFLDVGCANGLLMESLVEWVGRDGFEIEPYGLDLIPSLAALARGRLPLWSDRIFAANVMDWEPSRRFDLVRTELEYVPRRRRRDMVERLLSVYLVPGGRLVLCSYRNPHLSEPEPVTETLRDWGFVVAGEAEGVDTDGGVITRVAWTDLPAT